MSTLSVIQCAKCGQSVARVDENGWCEQCWRVLSSGAKVFQDLGRIVKQTVDSGVLTPEQLRQAIEMRLSNTSGPLTGTGFRSEAVEPTERGVWCAPPSAFDSEDGRRRNRIALFGACRG